MAIKNEDVKTNEQAPAKTEPTAAPAENTGAVSATAQAVPTEATSDSLNPAFASPEVQEQIKKDWQGGAEHTVDAEQVNKDAEKK